MTKYVKRLNRVIHLHNEPYRFITITYNDSIDDKEFKSDLMKLPFVKTV